MPSAIDLRSLMDTGGQVSGVENYLINILQNFGFVGAAKGNYFGFYNSYRKAVLPEIPGLPVRATHIPNKILNSSLRIFSQPHFERLYGNFDWLWLPDIRPFAVNKKTKVAVTVHDLSALVHPEFYSLKRRIWHRLINYKKTLRRANLIFTVSEYTKQDIIDILGIAEDKIKVIYPGINHDLFRPDLDAKDKERVKQKYNLPAKFILTISTLEPRKNLLNTVRAFEKIKDPEPYLIIAGRLGWQYQELINAIENSPRKDKIKMVGYIPENEKPLLISSAEIVCYPSYYEGFGFVPLEAMACGVPVITSARTSMPEIALDAALLAEPYNLND